jgi:hypothetical protein
VGIGRGTETGGASAEDFGPGFQLGMNFKADNGCKLHLFIPFGESSHHH